MSGGPQLRFLDDKGNVIVTLQNEALSFSKRAIYSSGALSFSDRDGNIRIALGGVLDPNNPVAEPQLSLYGRPSVTLQDSDGFKTVIGSIDLLNPRTGETSKTSAASVVLFDKDKKVLWKAP